MSKTFQHVVLFFTSPHHVYEALMDSALHSQFTGAPAEISREVGGSISAYGGYITGANLELEPDRKIVQRWRNSDWPEGVESQVTFDLQPDGSITRMLFTHSNVPDEFAYEVEQGWHDFYWEPMHLMLEKS